MIYIDLPIHEGDSPSNTKGDTGSKSHRYSTLLPQVCSVLLVLKIIPLQTGNFGKLAARKQSMTITLSLRNVSMVWRLQKMLIRRSVG